MYVPATFRESRLDAMHALMRAHPLGLLVTHGAAGLQASPVPFLLYADEGAHGVLRAHVARANPHWQRLDDVAECLVVFQAADGYVTPSWYPSKAATHRVVPTWNYATVHAWGRPRSVSDDDWLRRQLEDLTAYHESRRPRPWSVADVPVDFLASQMKAVVGIEIPIARIEGKWKMSQNKEVADRAGVVDGMRMHDDPHHNPAVADLVESAIGPQSAAARCGDDTA